MAEQMKVFNGYPRRNSRTYPRFPPKLEENHETSCSLRDEARFPCISCRAIPCSQSNREGALICLTEIERVPQESLTSLDEHCCHDRNVE